MGATKALLDAGGRTFLERVIHAHRAGGCSRVLVALPTLNGPLAAKAIEAGAQVVKNPAPEEGPIGSLRASLRVLDDSVEGVSFCPVDQPLIHEDTVRTLVDTFRQSGAPLVVPTFNGKRGHPVLFRRTLFEELLNETLPEGARTVVLKHRDKAVSVPVEDEGTIIDIDDMTAYRRYYPEEYRLHLQSGAMTSAGARNP
jgi:molybdenum cofactor cytidylyltransferase